uniref:prolyl endopeptidase-like isoform X2 n=1 Tax=Myxine glutinosa TaxID=7769 RepID=UPI00358F5CD9
MPMGFPLRTLGLSKLLVLALTRRLTCTPGGLRQNVNNELLKDIIAQESVSCQEYFARSAPLLDHLRKRLRACNQVQTDRMPEHIEVSEGYVYYEMDNRYFRCTLPPDRLVPWYKALDSPQAELLVDFQDLPVARLNGPFFPVRIRPSSSGQHLALITGSFEGMTKGLLLRLGSQPQIIWSLNNVQSFEWVTEEVLLFTLSEKLSTRQTFRLVLSEMPGVDPFMENVYMEHDHRFHVELARTRDRRYVTLNSISRDAAEVHLFECRSKGAAVGPLLMEPRTHGLLYHVESIEGRLFVLATDASDGGYRMQRVGPGSLGRHDWLELWRPRDNSRLLDMDFFQDASVACLAAAPKELPGKGGLLLEIISYDDPAQVHIVELPQWACHIRAGPNPDPLTSFFTFELSSPGCHPTRLRCDLTSGRLQTMHCSTGARKGRHQEVKRSGWCTVHQLKAQSVDGANVPLTLIAEPRAMELPSERPLLAIVYGAYGIPLSLAYKPEWAVLLHSGWRLAFCHVRGGGEGGRAWALAGRGVGRVKAAEDLAACLQMLHSAGLSRPSWTSLITASAGAVTAASMVNKLPNLVAAMVFRAPFLNVLESMLHPTTGGVQDRDEWSGACNDQDIGEVISIYCPLHNLQPQHYPSTYIACNRDDEHVPLEGTLHYAMKLRDANSEHARGADGAGQSHFSSVIVDVQSGGHCGPVDGEQYLEQLSKQLVFLWRELGLI